jgi:hypothetical protein
LTHRGHTRVQEEAPMVKTKARAKRTTRGGDEADTVRVTLRLPRSMLLEAEHRRVDERRTLNALVREALRAYLKAGR